MKLSGKRVLSTLLALVLCVSMLSGMVFSADAVAINYQTGDPTPVKPSEDTAYTGVIANWGTRGTAATYLSDNAIDFYASTSYDVLAQLTDSSTATEYNDDLYAALKSIMVSAHTEITDYASTRPLYAYTDCQNSNLIASSFYTGSDMGTTWNSNTWSREHTWPDSKGLGGDDENDVMMLRPAWRSENSSRSNKAYGESSNYYNPNKESNGVYDLRGDVARIMLYVYVRWGNTAIWGTDGVLESKEVMLKWMAEDPVDTWELGRNDSVQSITGTRNVFVDYPEFAFLLFNETVPSGMTTPSGKASGSTSATVTAESEDDAKGTVQVTGSTITATPATGYEVAGHEIVSGEATVTRSGNSFTVSATTDCTVRILFAKRSEYRVTFLEEGVQVGRQICYVGDSITLPAYTGTVPTDMEFMGWTAEKVTEETTTQPTLLRAGTSFTPTADTDLYALYTYGDQVFRLVTSESQLTVGSLVVIAAKDADAAVSINTNKKQTNRAQASITKNTADNTITFADDVEVFQLHKGEVTDTWAFCDQGDGKYLYANGNDNNNYLQSGYLAANGSFTITIDPTTYEATVVGNGGNTNCYMRYNATSSLFSCYKQNNNQKGIQLYVAAQGSNKYYITHPGCKHANIDMRRVASTASCSEKGYAIGDKWCTDCSTLIYEGWELDATGHVDAVWVQEVTATCKTEGIMGHYHCDACNADYLEKSADATAKTAADLKLQIDPQNHVGGTELKNQAAASCTVEGYTGDMCCVGCGAVLVAGNKTPVVHTLKKVEAKAATHEAAGNVQHYSCEKCGKLFDDDKASKELTAEQTVTAKQEHTYGIQYDPNGHWKVCECGSKLAPEAHTYGQWTTVKEATKEAEGSKERACTVCGYKQTEKIDVLSTTPITGDTARPGLWMIMALVSVCGMLMLIFLLPRKREQR